MIWVKRRGGELSRHLSAVSTFKVGGLWLFFTGVIGPIVLIWMLAAKVIDLVTGGYEGYATWYLGVAGWGSIVLAVVAAIVLPIVSWRHDPRSFEAWPTNKQLSLKGDAR